MIATFAYNKDNQEDKELVDTADTLIDTLRIYADMMRGDRQTDNMRAAVMQGFTTATDWRITAEKGMPSATATKSLPKPCAMPMKLALI